jgi:hypothetical protein
MKKNNQKENSPFFIINVGTLENPVLKYRYRKTNK